MSTERLARACFAVSVACPRKQKFATVNVIERYELNVLFSAVPANRDKKYGVAVIKAALGLQ